MGGQHSDEGCLLSAWKVVAVEKEPEEKKKEKNEETTKKMSIERVLVSVPTPHSHTYRHKDILESNRNHSGNCSNISITIS